VLAFGTALLLSSQAAPAQGEATGDPLQLDATAGLAYSTDAHLHGVLTQPRWQLLPDFEIARGGAYIGTEHGLGYRLVNNPTLVVGLGVDYRAGRRESAQSIYHGLGSVRDQAVAAAYAEWNPFGPALTLYGDIDAAPPSQRGTSYTAGMRGGAPVGGGVTLFADVSLDGANGDYMQTFYGVDAAQSQASGLPGYRPSAGLISLTAAAGFLIDVAPHWQLITSAGGFRFADGVAQSPLVPRRAFPIGLLAINYSY
jgi:outer membrane scaffolding protein for murein synthesis (MipA/OmpV family)